MDTVIVEYAGTEYTAYEFEDGYYLPDLGVLLPASRLIVLPLAA